MRQTYMAKASEVERNWVVLDATDIPLGRLAAVAASMLRGKNKPTFTPNVDTGDYVIIVNAEKVKLTGKKALDKKYYRHSGYPGGIKETTAGKLREEKPERLIETAIRGMLPKSRLGRKQFTHLHVYAGNDHKHQAQQPQVVDLEKLI
ncbi:50S ribosomal protein L13 [Aerococcus christensenii]|uniref:Large ribosomal subunit protein uL13 n=1 Tax=Aerococcus christensenii TaxID=87541 RepID=A0A0X8F897_9LACT|nr:50S ribosomal protein L13 [Aerococcus christensenii]AMB92624.1 50S ribosomal protein L13 [Aerococcus christensenii]KXB35826.1 ribosomal protein L13 [Aerococcus christensenii]MDK8233830.1 50S ribosomal protein L13 [Aerococcus christensenii]PKY90933.1 50S ribosomal protein L13 [Aerococcus christensenii]WEB71232.1 50S ribosomal protein L13 [Aerococcus christensenii]